MSKKSEWKQKTCPERSTAWFPTSHAEVKRIMEETIARGCEEEVAFWIRHIINSVHATRGSCQDIPFWNLLDLVDYCFDFQIEDSKLVIDVLDVVDRFANMLNAVLVRTIIQNRTLTQSQIEKRKQKGLRTFDCLTYLLHHASEMKRNFSGRWFSSKGVLSAIDFPPVFYAIKHGSKTTLLTLLQYGFPVGPEEFWDRSYGSSEEELRHAAESARRYRGTRGLPEDKNIADFPKDLFWLLVMLVRTFGARFSRQMEVLKSWEKFYIIWRAIPYSFVTLNKSEADQTVHDCWECFCEINKTGLSIMFSGALQPRSLKHLCRCTVRESLRQNWKLPHGIKDLGLPARICEYLNLEID